MTSNNATIMGSELNFELELQIIELCGINKKKYMINKNILTRQDFESHLEEILNFYEKSSNKYSLSRVLSVIILRTGSNFPEEIKYATLDNLDWSDEKEFWKMNPKFLEERKFYLKDFRTKILNYEVGHPVHLVDLKAHGNIDFDKTCIGVDQMNLELEKSTFEKFINLNLDSCDLNSFPHDIYKFKNLMILSMENNHIRHIPKEITKLNQLRELYLSNNRITALNPYLMNLEFLEVLDLSYNLVNVIPNSIRSTYTLKHLNLNHNPINFNN